jgi:hypothetical protein
MRAVSVSVYPSLLEHTSEVMLEPFPNTRRPIVAKVRTESNTLKAKRTDRRSDYV